LRSGKPVFCYDIGTSELSLDTDRPLDLAVFASYNRNDSARVRQICQFLNQARNFDVWLDVKDLSSGALWEKEIEAGLADRLNRGGYVIAFWSENASRSKWIEKELATAAADIDQLNDKVLFALLEPSPFPSSGYGSMSRMSSSMAIPIALRLTELMILSFGCIG
jgi:TIR domain